MCSKLAHVKSNQSCHVPNSYFLFVKHYNMTNNRGGAERGVTMEDIWGVLFVKGNQGI